MIRGFESFRRQFASYPDCYTIIGGAACDILMAEENLSFRATRDIDMILILEAREKEFAEVFWDYIRTGEYRCGWKNSNEAHYYRFTEPKAGYPVQIELFSRHPDYDLQPGNGIVPIHIDDNVSSLSAILLDDEYYHFMMQGRRIVEDVPVLDTVYLIPFKMFAWLNLCDQKARGEHVNEHDMKKHKYDVFRLLQIVETGTHLETTGHVQETIRNFLGKIQNENLRLEQIGIQFDQNEGIGMIRDIYSI